MRIRMAGVVVLLGSLLCACQVAVSGSPTVSASEQQRADQRAEQWTAFEGALKALEVQPMVTYHSTVNGTPLVLHLTNGGTMLGVLPVDGYQARVVGVDNQLYLAASVEYWRAHGAVAGDRFAQGWTRVDPAEQLALDPASALTPAGVSARLRAARSTVDQLADPVRGKLADGTEVFELASPLGSLKVTSAQPHRLVSFAPGLLDAQVGRVFGLEFRLDPVNIDTVKRFRQDLDAAVIALGQAADSAAQVSVTVKDNKVECNGATGSCSSTVQVENRLAGGAPKAPTVRLVMTAELSVDGIGKQTCSGEASMAPNTVGPVACRVKFKLPNRTAEYQVVSLPSVVAEVIASLDLGATQQRIQTEFSALGG